MKTTKKTTKKVVKKTQGRKLKSDTRTVLMWEAGEKHPNIYTRPASQSGVWVAIPLWRGEHYINRYVTTAELQSYLDEAARNPGMYSKIRLSKHGVVFEKTRY